MRLFVVATMKGDLGTLFDPVAESFHECFGELPVVAEIKDGMIRASLELTIDDEDQSQFLTRFLELGKLIGARDSGVSPETQWFDLDQVPSDVILARTMG